MNAAFAIRSVELLFAFVFFIQTIEYFFMLSQLGPGGTLAWKNLNGVYSGTTKKILDFIFCHTGFIIVLLLRILISFYLFIQCDLSSCIVAFILQILVLLRFKGNFNGGSDFMVTQVLLGLLLYYLLPQKWAALGLWYIGVQLLNSYFIAGIIKIKNPDWRSGKAVSGFLQTTTYSLKPGLDFLIARPFLTLVFSWSVMAWEISFPLSLLNLKLALIMLGIGLIFHVGVWYTFGLNRFIFSWISAYPALIYCVTSLRSHFSS